MADMQFFLMHKDDIVAAIAIDDVSGAIVRVGRDGDRDLLPLGGRQSADALRKWWLRRAVPINQGHISRYVQEADIPSTQNLLVRNLGLSLSDHYWIKPISSELEWKDVSLFSNPFRDEIGSRQITVPEEQAYAASSAYSPGASLQGDLIKKWIIQNGERCLIKGNKSTNSQQSLNEVLASLLHKKQGFANYVSYQPCAIFTEGASRIGCICADFATEELEFIPAIDVVASKKCPNDVSQYAHFITICAEHGMDEDACRGFLEYQILTDFILTNTDRHLNNFGVLRNTKTLKFEKMAPIFDTGNSMFWDNPRLPDTNDLTSIQINSFRSTEMDMLKYLTKKAAIDFGKLPTTDEIASLYALDDLIPCVSLIQKGYLKKIEILQKWAVSKLF